MRRRRPGTNESGRNKRNHRGRDADSAGDTWDDSHQGQPALRWRLLGVVGIAAAVYANTLRCGLVIDDNEAISSNEDVVGPVTDLGAIFSHDFWGRDIRSRDSHKSYRPLTTLSFRLQVLLAAATDAPADDAHVAPPAMALHAGNVVLHCAVAAMVLLVAQRHKFCRDVDGATAAAALFAVHPVHTEAVAGVVGRADLMAMLFVLCGVYALPTAGERERLIRVVAASAFVALGFLCKETAIMSLGVLVVCGLPRGCHWKGVRAKRLIVCCCAGLVMLLGRQIVTRSHDGASGFLLRTPERADNPIPHIEDAMSRMFTTVYCWVVYARLLVAPIWLAVDYSFDAIPAVSFPMDSRMLEIVVFAGVVGFTAWLIAAKRWLTDDGRWRLLVAVAFTVCPMIPAAHVLFAPGTFVAERLLYLPSLGICLVVGDVLGSSISSRTLAMKSRITRALLLALLIAGGGLRTVTRNADWVSERTIYESAMSVSPRSVRVQFMAGLHAYDDGNMTAALEYLDEAERIDPEFCEVNYWKARMAAEGNNIDDAIVLFTKALDCRVLEHDIIALDALQQLLPQVLRAKKRDASAAALYAMARVKVAEGDASGAATFYKAAASAAEREGDAAWAAQLGDEFRTLARSMFLGGA